MVSYRTGEVGYGTVGEIVYDSGQARWISSRFILRSRRLLCLGSSRDLSVNEDAAQDASHNITTARKGPHQISGLLEVEPFLAAARDALVLAFRLARQNEVHSLFSRPYLGDIYAKCFNEARHVFEYEPLGLLAVLSGDVGQHLRFGIVQKNIPQARRNNGTSLQSSGAGFLAQALWQGDNTPIQKIRYGLVRDGEWPLVAVRTLRATYMLEPQKARRRSSKASIVENTGRNRLICYSVGLTVPSDYSTKEAYTDVTFNPWDQMHCALVDCRGVWTVYELTADASKQIGLKASSLYRGQLSRAFSGTEDAGSSNQRHSFITWTSNAESLLVAGGAKLCVYRLIPDGDYAISSTFELERGDLLLDVQLSPQRLDDIFLLSSNYVIILRANESSKAPSLGAGQLRRLLTLRHNRDVGDLQLRMALACEGAKDVRLLLYSQDNFVMSAYLFRVPTETNAVVMLAGPEELQFNASGESHSVMRSNVLNMQLRPDRSLADKDIADDDSLPGRYLAKYHVSLVLADLSLIEKEVVAVSSRQSAVIGTADALPNLPESVVSRIGGGLSGIEVPSASVLGVGRPRCVGRVSIRDTKLEHAREILLHTDRHGCELASKVGQLLYPDGAESSPILKAGVLFDLIGTNYICSDVDTAENALDRFLGARISTPFEKSKTYVSDKLESPYLRYLSAQQILPRLSLLLADVAQDWTASDSSILLSNVKEHQIRRQMSAITEIYLASITLSVTEKTTAADVSSSEHGWAPANSTKRHSLLLPVRPHPSNSRMARPSNDLTDPINDILSPNAAAISGASASSPSDPQAPSPAVASWLSAVQPAADSGKTFDDRPSDFPALQKWGCSPRGDTLDDRTRRCLSHWPTGEDPYHYHWRTVMEDLEDEDGFKDGEAAVRPQARSKMAKAERQERRRRVQEQRLAEGMGKEQRVHIVVATVDRHSTAARSSPVPAPGAEALAVAPSRLVASQVERGRFGGKLPAAAPSSLRKRKRDAGF